MNTPPRFLLRIPVSVYDAMIEQARAELPVECCGLLAGRFIENGTVGEVSKRYPLINDLKSPTEFQSEPRSMFAAVKDMRAKGIEVLAVYHSHPTSEPIPSKRDLDRNAGGNVVNLIIGLAGAMPEMRAWWLSDSQFEAARFELTIRSI